MCQKNLYLCSVSVYGLQGSTDIIIASLEAKDLYGLEAKEAKYCSECQTMKIHSAFAASGRGTTTTTGAML
jgi:hypothetical protein